MSEATGCANCGRAIDGPAQKFCPACGQATPAHRIDWHFMLHEFEHSVLHMDRGILYSLKELMLRPGRLMRDYLEGRRARQAKPFLLLMVMAAVIVFLGKLLFDGHLVESSLPAFYSGGMSPGAEAEAVQVALANGLATVSAWMNRNYAVWTLLLIPVEALALRLAFFGVRRLNYPEWLVITAFLTVQMFVFWGLAMPLQRWFPSAASVALGVAFCYGVYSLVQLFGGYPRWKSVLRALVGFGAFGLIGGLLTIALALVLAVLQLR
ncbi:DUF3667 domain-containing protein [Pseudoxanthomonas daejeonensis]|uniref:DUF3667 domain-containing protein n=1 Tax=Pseudoxanthomonas daejeonensis TaxID=266062 RepID=UPI001F54444D|nr:DUF3667 domain-containing protein [Pseudoxanthomonas daejeonensis]UNK56500.1 DUF3667 domain-containing protein [Pseudoxanthomonas daejeonensis]